jgi:ribonuclease BN (tRNA processing enzyme)
VIKDKELLEVQVIGAGSAFSKKYFNTSLLITFQNGYRLLVDCGHDVPKALHEMNIPINTIDGLLVTHLHGDHVNGIEELAFMNRYVFNRKMDLWVPHTLRDELWESVLRGGLEKTEEGTCDLVDYFHIKHLYTMSIHDLDLGIKIYPTDHVKNKHSYAVSFQDKLFYSADTKFDLELIEIADRFPVIIHDCQVPLPTGKIVKGGVHAHLHELMGLPEEIQKKTYMIHYGDNVDTFVGRTGKLRFATEGTIYLI